MSFNRLSGEDLPDSSSSIPSFLTDTLKPAVEDDIDNTYLTHKNDQENKELVNDKVTEKDNNVEETNDEKDIDLVISQVSCTQSQAVTALKNNNGNIINAVMELTDYLTQASSGDEDSLARPIVQYLACTKQLDNVTGKDPTTAEILTGWRAQVTIECDCGGRGPRSNCTCNVWGASATDLDASDSDLRTKEHAKSNESVATRDTQFWVNIGFCITCAEKRVSGTQSSCADCPAVAYNTQYTEEEKQKHNDKVCEDLNNLMKNYHMNKF